jgi:hypothetical protein
MVATCSIHAAHTPEVALQLAVLHQLCKRSLAYPIALSVDVETNST